MLSPAGAAQQGDAETHLSLLRLFCLVEVEPRYVLQAGLELSHHTPATGVLGSQLYVTLGQLILPRISSPTHTPASLIGHSPSPP